MSTILEDTFQRAAVSSPSWGTATDGHPWTLETNSATTVAVSSNTGQITGGSGSGTNLLLGSASRTDAEVLVQTSLSDPTAASHQILRFVSHGNFYYAGQDLNNVIAIKVRVGDVGTQLASAASTLTANQKYWIRFRAQGTTLSLRIWQDGTAEPGTWNLTTTDSTYAAGTAGYRGTPHTTSDTVSIYSFQASDLTTTPANQLVADTFTRADGSGWGTASDGEPWVAKDANATYSILSNRGKTTGFNGSSSNTVLGGAAIYDGDYKVRFSTSAPSADGCFFITRFTSIQNAYFIGFVQNQVSLRKIVSNVSTTVQNVAFTATSNTNYWMRCLQVGTSIKLKIWADGSSEPTSWNLTNTDSALTQGNPGLRLFGGVSDIVLVDNLTVNVIAGGHVLLSEGYGGVFS